MRHRLFRARKVITTYSRPPHRPEPTGLLVVGERVVDVGEFEHLNASIKGAEIVDFGEGVISPGFIDAHAHPSIVAEDVLDGIDVSPLRCESASELIALASDRARRTEPGTWLRCYGYDPTEWADPTPVTRKLLDAAVPDHPAIVIQASCHWAVLNSAALAEAGYVDKDDAPPGGELGVDLDGRLNGLAYEQALFDVAFPAKSTREPVMPRKTARDLRSGLQLVWDQMHSVGITSVVDALAGPEAIELYQESESANELTMRVSLLVPYEAAEPLWRLRLHSGYGSDYLRLLGVKLIADGAIAGRTCAVDEPFLGEDTDDDGLLLLDAEELEARIRKVAEAGLIVGVHANGERAIRATLNALERIGESHRVHGFRHRIEHCTLVKPDLVERMKRLDVCAVPFSTYIYQHGRKLLSWYGRERLERMFPHGALLEAGVTVAGSSDYPCATFDPIIGTRTCVTRWAPGVSEVLGPSQRITPRQALELYTVGGAASEGQGANKGELLPGRLADFVVLNNDPVLGLAEDPQSEELEVTATYVGGRQVWPNR